MTVNAWAGLFGEGFAGALFFYPLTYYVMEGRLISPFSRINILISLIPTAILAGLVIAVLHPEKNSPSEIFCILGVPLAASILVIYAVHKAIQSNSPRFAIGVLCGSLVFLSAAVMIGKYVVAEHQKTADGDVVAQYNTGVAYRDGLGVAQNYQEAANWFRLAADQGNGQAQVNLAAMYYQGQGVQQDYGQAAQLYLKAADQGLAPAQSTLAAMYANGIGVPQDYIQALLWGHKAADQGDSNAQYGLGYMYHAGLGVPQDFIQAMTWYIIAKANGSTLSDQNLRQLESNATPAQTAEAQGKAREWWAAHHPGG